MATNRRLEGRDMLEINPQVVCDIIDKAREFHAQEQVVIPEEPLNPADDWALQVLADHEDDMTFQEVRTAINDLETEQQVTLVALMWLGRGDYSEDQWEEALVDAEASWTPRTPEYLMATPLVADYLTEGLALLGYECG
jgi:hypothetical protein